MYLYHYGLAELPFNLTPDTDFYCELPVYSDAMNVLRIAIETGEGFVKVIGEEGTGKTMLCRMLLNYLEKRAHCAYLPPPCENVRLFPEFTDAMDVQSIPD